MGHKAAKTIEQNKLLIERYPFLLPRNVWTDKIPEDYDYSYTLLDNFPEGWRIAFGELMMEDLREVLVRTDYLNEFRILQIKEKYGSLRFYTGGAPKGIQEIIDAYEFISANVCIKCGKLDVPMTNGGWIMPECKECWEKENAESKYPSTYKYEDIIDEDTPCVIPSSYKINRYSNGITTTETIDISEYANKIREAARIRER